ncbi:MAG TPA: enoyl-CoA hydratase-related protein [Planctomycetota bacterium]|nr:enoyl-CoA hydratase-related protein [Planctomycetota bacterium]
MPDSLRIERDGALARIIFAREKGLNILSVSVLNELKEAWRELESARARVCILRGEGKAFLAGADIKEMSGYDGFAARDFAALGQGVFDAIEHSDIVSIAAIHGACLGGGCELALACDIRIGSTGMMIGQPEVNIGLVPGFGGSQRLPRVVGNGWALRMILSGEPINETAALQAGLITEFGDPADLPQRAEKLARTILSRGPQAVAIAKKLTRGAFNSKQNAGMDAERYAFGNTFESGEAAEGTKAFLEKRAPNFK